MCNVLVLYVNKIDYNIKNTYLFILRSLSVERDRNIRLCNIYLFDNLRLKKLVYNMYLCCYC
jgi:hypothetical protein